MSATDVAARQHRRVAFARALIAYAIAPTDCARVILVQAADAVEHGIITGSPSLTAYYGVDGQALTDEALEDEALELEDAILEDASAMSGWLPDTMVDAMRRRVDEIRELLREG
jgi:hypothetical protein